ncbi:MAG: hydroxymethylglutaryl-CoA lyase [Oligoflexia bacterium]|nr:hydroxymethylglutaryl-CoA lyase [Oligoflexia bacterium]
MEVKKIRIVEVGPRDGLQNESKIKKLELDELIACRVGLITKLANSGLVDVEAGAFVRADRVPQMAGTDQVLAILQKDHPKLWKTKKFWSLVPNRKGLELALKAGAKHISVFTATSDAFNEKNIQMTVEESLRELKPVIKEAKENGCSIRAYISTVWGCPYSGKVSPGRALGVAKTLLDFGAEEISLGDTIGVASPKQVKEILELFPKSMPLAVHFHDTRGTAIANCLEAIHLGIHSIDSSCGGLGGCPYAKGASGNLATEDLLYMLHEMGYSTGVQLDKVCEASLSLEETLELSLPSRFYKAWKGSK